jgi:hypothetical protein
MSIVKFTPVSPPPRRWHQSRKLRYGVALLIVAVGGVFLYPWLFMPADLRRMQGLWKVDRILEDGKPGNVDGERFRFTGNIVAILDTQGNTTETLSINLDGDLHQMTFYGPRVISLFGRAVNLPLWLARSSDVAETTSYELNEQGLILRARAHVQGRELVTEFLLRRE